GGDGTVRRRVDFTGQVTAGTESGCCSDFADDNPGCSTGTNCPTAMLRPGYDPASFVTEKHFNSSDLLTWEVFPDDSGIQYVYADTLSPLKESELIRRIRWGQVPRISGLLNEFLTGPTSTTNEYLVEKWEYGTDYGASSPSCGCGGTFPTKYI